MAGYGDRRQRSIRQVIQAKFKDYLFSDPDYEIRIISILTALTLTVALSTTSFADPATNSSGVVDETQTVTQDDLSSGSTTQSADVGVTKSGSFSVTIPKKITLPGSPTGGKHEQSYNITVKGDIRATSRLFRHVLSGEQASIWSSYLRYVTLVGLTVFHQKNSSLF